MTAISFSVAALTIASVLPQRIEPYIALMGVGFFVGVFGHLARSRWLVLIGILLIFAATLLFPIAINLFSDQPEAPGQTVPSPY